MAGSIRLCTCGQTFNHIDELLDHNLKHKQKPLIRCRKCRQNFTSTVERDRHFQTSPLHFYCRYCKSVTAFSNADSLRYHYIDRHRELYCHLCDRHFATTVRRFNQARHRSCSVCRKMFPVPELCNDRCRTCSSKSFGKGFPDAMMAKKKGERLPDHYTRLGIGAYSSHEQVLKAAKEMRVKMHADRRKRRDGLTEEEMRMIDMEAALVGQAADVLSDPDLRLKYDCKVQGW